MKIIKLFEEFSNVFTIFNFDKITKDWKVFENDTLDDLRNYQLNEDGSLSFSMKTDSKSITINKLEKLIQNLSNEMDILNVTYWKMSNFSNIFICDENILKFSSNRLEHSVDEWKMANKFVGKDIPGLVKYYKTWHSNVITPRNGKRPGPFYAILMQRIDELEQSETKLFNKFYETLKLDETSKSITKESMLIKLSQNFTQNELINEFVELFFLLKGIVPLDDFRGDNLGRVDGKLTHFDPMDRGEFV
jgi:hypothetical protein